MPVFVRLFASWCPHCKQLKPVWNELVETNIYKDQIYFASIECERSLGLCKELFPGDNYPRLYWWDTETQTPYRYMGERSLPRINDYISKQLNFPLIEVNDSEIEVYKERSNITTSFIFNIMKIDETRMKQARNLSSGLRHMESPFLLHESDKNTFEAFIGNNIVVDYKGDWNYKEMKAFVELYSLPFMTSFNPYVLRHVENLSMPILVSIDRNNSNINNTDIMFNVKDIIHTSATNCIDSEWLCRFTSTYEGDPDALLILVDWKKRLFWVYKGNKKELDVRRWVIDVKNGRIKGEGPGTGLFSGVRQAYYDFLAGGKKFHIQYLIYVPGFITIILVWVLLCKNDDTYDVLAMEKYMEKQRVLKELEREESEKHIKED